MLRTTGGTVSAAAVDIRKQPRNILCCICGISIQPNSANTCASCLRSRTDVTEGIEREQILCRCRGCDRFRRGNGAWSACPLESRELLAICLEKLKGSLKKVRFLIECTYDLSMPGKIITFFRQGPTCGR